MTIYPNPDFDEIFFFPDIEVISSRERYKQVELNGRILYERIPNKGTENFKIDLKNRLSVKKKNRWPYNKEKRIMLSIGVSGTKKIYGVKDLDNISKPILDAFTGIVFEDDKQIELLIVSKQIWEFSMIGIFVGLRLMAPYPAIDKYVPALYGIKEDHWSSVQEKKPLFEPGEVFASFEIYE